MSNESIDNRNEMLEWFGLFVILFAGFSYVVYYYYVDVWYHVKYGMFLALSYLPEMVRSIMFFYSDQVVSLIVPMKEDLAYHAADYAYYYTENQVGVGKRESISTLAMYISGPYLLVAIAVVAIRGGKPFRPAIQLPGPSKTPAMYAYARSQMLIWPYIKPVVYIMQKIVKQSDLDSDWFAMAQLPIMWLKKNDLLFTIAKSRRTSITQSERKEFSLNRKILLDHGKGWMTSPSKRSAFLPLLSRIFSVKLKLPDF
jgi:hypothetical protein